MISSNDFWVLAERDYKLCLRLEGDFPDEYAVSAATYHIQQAVEKVLKGTILFLGGEVEFTHNVIKLITQCEQLGEIIEEDLKDIADTLTIWETTNRYDPFINFSQKKYNTAKASYVDLSNKLTQQLSLCEAQQESETPGFELKME